MRDINYTRDDIGCYIDASRGIYATDMIVDFSRDHGASIEHDAECVREHVVSAFDSEFAGCEWAGEFECDATDYMNDHYGVDGCYWGRAESGDWGLWEDDDD